MSDTVPARRLILPPRFEVKRNRITPLNTDRGEDLREHGLDAPYHIEALDKWTDTAFWPPVYDSVVEGFKEAGAAEPITFETKDVLVQVYPTIRPDPVIAFIFHRVVDGVSLNTVRKVHLPQEAVASLKAVGRWDYSLLIH